MSGGHWNYDGERIRDAMETIAFDTSEQWPTVSQMFATLADVLSKAEHDMDWHLSGDTHIEDHAAFDKKTAGYILTELLKHAPDEWFPHGKWATIQALQERTDGSLAPAKPEPEDGG